MPARDPGGKTPLSAGVELRVSEEGTANVISASKAACALSSLFERCHGCCSEQKVGVGTPRGPSLSPSLWRCQGWGSFSHPLCRQMGVGG